MIKNIEGWNKKSNKETEKQEMFKGDGEVAVPLDTGIESVYASIIRQGEGKPHKLFISVHGGKDGPIETAHDINGDWELVSNTAAMVVPMISAVVSAMIAETK